MAKQKKAKSGEEPEVASDTEQDAILEGVAKSINKDYGERTVSTLSAAPANQDYAFQVSTGSLGLDLAIGPLRKVNGVWRHGVPSGKILEVYGPESSGKTTLLLHMMAIVQRWLPTISPAIAHRAAMIDVEHALDPTYARQIGVVDNQLYFSQPDTGEQGLEVLDRLLKTNLFGIIGLDSVAGLITAEEMDGNITDAHVGGQARLMSQALRKIASYLGGSTGCETIVFFTNQLRDKINTTGYGGSKETTPGGRALRFYSDLRLDVRMIQSITDGTAIADGGMRIGQRVKVTCVKNKMGPPYRSAEFPLIYGYGIDRRLELAELCVDYGIVHKSATWLTYENTKVQGLNQLAAAISEDPRGLGMQLYDQLLTQVQASRGYSPEGVLLPGAVEPTPNITDAGFGGAVEAAA